MRNGVTVQHVKASLSQHRRDRALPRRNAAREASNDHAPPNEIAGGTEDRQRRVPQPCAASGGGSRHGVAPLPRASTLPSNHAAQQGTSGCNGNNASDDQRCPHKSHVALDPPVRKCAQSRGAVACVRTCGCSRCLHVPGGDIMGVGGLKERPSPAAMDDAAACKSTRARTLMQNSPFTFGAASRQERPPPCLCRPFVLGFHCLPLVYSSSHMRYVASCSSLPARAA